MTSSVTWTVKPVGFAADNVALAGLFDDVECGENVRFGHNLGAGCGICLL